MCDFNLKVKRITEVYNCRIKDFKHKDIHCTFEVSGKKLFKVHIDLYKYLLV